MRRLGRKQFAAVLLLVALAVGTTPLRAEPTAPAPSEPEVRAAFLLNFARFVTWPEGTFAEPDSLLVFGIYGENTVREALQTALTGKKVHARTPVVRVVQRRAEAMECHVLFVPDTGKPVDSGLLASLENRPVLTVGESETFIDQGGVICLVRSGKKLQFEVNLDAAGRCGLTLSSKLSALATRVIQAKSQAGR